MSGNIFSPLTRAFFLNAFSSLRRLLRSLGCPLLGDDKYGDREANRRAKVAGQRLWAARVGFAFPKGHPLERLNSLSICSEPPWL